MSGPDELAQTLRAAAALEDPSRRRLYEFVRSSAAPVTRENAAAELGISHKLAAFHLDKLVASGLLVAGYDRATRHRPLGRTPKTYSPSALELRLSIPQRRPELLAEILLAAVATAGAGESPHEAATRSARAAGHRTGRDRRDLHKLGRLGTERALTVVETVLRERGYEPTRISPARLRLDNCPFRPLAAQATDLVCGLNEQYMIGLLDGLQVRTAQAVLAPSPGRCCVELCAAPRP